MFFENILRKHEETVKKIDLHIHSLPTQWDVDFSFEQDILERYVSGASLDAIAITNHNLFDRNQFEEIKRALKIAVFPGIEVTLDCGHILVISDLTNLDSFEEQTAQISSKITQEQDNISIDEFTTIFTNLDQHLVIPHYDKKPAIRGPAFERLKAYASCGEVDSAKKFLRAIKDDAGITPVLFSDARICEKLNLLPIRQTYVDCGEISLKALKSCLQDKRKVALSRSDGNKLFQVLQNGLQLSTGLNILLGERSSGKTYTLDKICESQENVKYIKQFSLVQQDDAAYEREFSKNLQRTRSQCIDEYLSGFKTVLSDVMRIDLRTDDRAVEDYINSLIKSAEEADRRDTFSSTALYDESEFPTRRDKVLFDLIASVRHIIENVEFRDVISKHIDIHSMKKLAVELIELLWVRRIETKKKKLVNGLVRDIKGQLQTRTSAAQVKDVDFYRVALNKRKVNRFIDIVKSLQKEATISEEPIRNFRIVATRGPFTGAGEIKVASGVATAFKDAFMKYDSPYDYLQELLNNNALAPAILYKLFAKITYQILNKDGFEVSGGERSEFRLLQEINDAQNHDILLIDEPESSFDNIFLNSDVNQIIREISATMPVVVVTHNSTVGASAGADFLLYTCKTFEDGRVVYRRYYGHPTDKSLQSLDGKTISNHEITLNSLEAGSDTYDRRRKGYEAIKDRG